MRKLCRYVPFLLCVFAYECGAVRFTNGINDSNWSASGSVFECRLAQTVPLFGQVVFRTRAGESSSFYLRSKVAQFEAGEAALVARSPVWAHPQVEEVLGSVPVKRGTRPLWLGREKTELMLAGLNSGKEIALLRESWYDEAENVDLAISNIGFRSEYRKYLDCLAGLLPANFDQLKRTSLYFVVGYTDKLSRAATRKLDQILLLVKHDKAINQFIIDAHASAEGTRIDNLELSKTRADLVRDYLVGHGIPESQLVVRWHGERYPVASNASSSGRAKNRRVTVRMEKLEQSDAPPASNTTMAAQAADES